MRDTWKRSVDNELGRLADGLPKELLGTKTIDFIKKSNIPIGKKVTYASMVCDIRPLKSEKI